MQRRKNLGIVGIDSVSSLVTTDEAKKDPRDEDRIGAQARMMSKALRRITTVNKKTLFLWTNQERMDVGVKFGNPKTTSGGRALRYYATGRIEFRRGGAHSRGVHAFVAENVWKPKFNLVAGFRCASSRTSQPDPTVKGAFVFNHDLKMIDPAYEILQLGLEDELIERSSTGRYSYVDLDDKEWKGTEKQFTNWLRTKEELAQELITAIQDNTRNDSR
jgi:recombination protein RecA